MAMTLEDFVYHASGAAGTNLWALPEPAGITVESEVQVLRAGIAPKGRGWINLGDAGNIAHAVTTIGFYGPSIVLDQLVTNSRR